jgi:hypothetical protein
MRGICSGHGSATDSDSCSRCDTAIKPIVMAGFGNDTTSNGQF